MNHEWPTCTPQKVPTGQVALDVNNKGKHYVEENFDNNNRRLCHVQCARRTTAYWL